MQPEGFGKIWNVSRETIFKLEAYHALLLKWQKAINLVSPKTLDGVWERHFADSAQLAEHIPENSKIADLGSGAGFPGLVLAIMRPDLEVHLIESDLRKSEFLKNVSRETFSKTTIHNDRVEKILPGLEIDIITARAFAPLTEILGMTERTDAELLLLKGKSALEEVEQANELYEFSCEHLRSRSDGDGFILKIRDVKKR